MEIFDSLLKILGKLKDWATEPLGFFALLMATALCWSVWQLVKHLTVNVRARRDSLQNQINDLKEELTQTRLDFEISKLEYVSDTTIDGSHFETLRTLYVELRGLFISKLGGQRQTPQEFNDIEMRYQVLRKDRHDEKGKRIDRAAQAITRARERLANERIRGRE